MSDSLGKDAAALHDSPLAHVRGGMDLCVHCGFCLQACPTYLALEDENDSPRGRIVLMHSLLDGEIPSNDAALQSHISRCLGCRGCETACPSGVPFGHLLEATRATLREEHGTPFLARVILAVFASPALLGFTMFFARVMRGVGLAKLLSRLPGAMGGAFAMLASTAPTQFSRRSPVTRHPSPVTRDPSPVTRHPSPVTRHPSPVTLFEGCVMRELYGHVHNSTRAVLGENDYMVVPARNQGCCGALHAHTGDLEKAKSLARRNIDAFEQSTAEKIAVNAAGCGAMLKEYAQLLANDPAYADRAKTFSARVADITELLEKNGPRAGGPVDIKVAYDAPCHLQHAQRVVSAPLALFKAIPGLELYQSPDNDKCCGAAGIYNLLEPDTSAAVLAPKLAELLQSGARVVTSGNPGCMMQIGAGLLRSGSNQAVAHPVELLDYSYSQKGASR